MLSSFCDHVIVGSVRVHPPKRYVLLCGGEVSDIHSTVPLTLRDAFLKGDGVSSLKTAEVLQIEEITEFFDKDSPYVDLVQFEADLAQICELVLLFPESPGSFAELGCFAGTREIAEKLLVVIRGKYLGKSSFITKGPIANLRRDYPQSVFSVIDATIDLPGSETAGVDGKVLVAKLAEPIGIRLNQVASHTTLNTTNFNHLCKLYVGLLREGYCLKDDELVLLLAEFGFEVDGD